MSKEMDDLPNLDIYLQSFEAILKACSWRFDLRPLAQQCQEVIKKVKQQKKDRSFNLITQDDNPMLRALLQASSVPTAKIAEPAICCLQRLISNGVLISNINTSAFTKEVVDSIIKCSSSNNAEVQLAVVKTLLTAATSETFVVKGEILLQSFKMMFNLAVGSHFENIRSTAVASLQQLLSVWFRRAAAEVVNTPPVSPNTSYMGNGEDASQSGYANSTGNGISARKIANLAENADISGLEKVLTSRLTEEQDHLNGSVDSQKNRIIRKNSNDNPNTSIKRRSSIPQLLGLETDLFVLLRSLCRLAARNVEPSTSEMFVVDGKFLAMGLINHVLQFSAWSMLSSPFVLRSRNLLCVVLIRNANSPFEVAAKFQVEILTAIMMQPTILKEMKPEIGAFMPLLILNPLESFSPDVHLLTASCTALKLICGKEQLLLDLFVNYDCDISGTNVFERIVQGLCNILISGPSGYTLANANRMKHLAANCLAKILESLKLWYTKYNSEAGHVRSEDESIDAEQNSKTQGQQVMEAMTMKKSFNDGITLFNKNPIKGMRNLVESGVIASSIDAQAEFLFNTADLDKSAKGQFLGNYESNQIAVMHAYTDKFNFTDLEFDIALRLYLGSFRLPGEAQQIDRLMEKFADRFCTCNPDIFSSADQAYSLAYATIMLNTDMHNPLAEHMMSKNDFVGMVSQCPVEGVDTESKQLSPEYLGSIFDRIAANEIKINDDAGKTEQHKSTVSSQLVRVLRKSLPFRRMSGDSNTSEMHDSLNRIQEILKSRKQNEGGVSGRWISADTGEITVLLVEIVCKYFLELYDGLGNKKHPQALLHEIVKSSAETIVLAGETNVKSACEELVSAMTNMITLEKGGNANIPESTRIKAFKELTGIALNHSSILKGSWTHVLHCLSIGQYYALEGTSDNVLANSGITKDEIPSSAEEDFRKFMQSEGLHLIDQIFTGSGSMDGQTIVMFVTAMCAVNRQELEVSSLPGLELILLQRLIETVHHNLDRIKMVWSRLWAVTSAHLVGASCEDNVDIAMYSVDALRQIVFKLLKHQELSNFKYQDDALKPFVLILRQSEVHEIHTFTVQCIHQIVVANLKELQSGWNSVLDSLKIALNNENIDVVEPALHILKQAWTQKYLPLDNFYTDLRECFIIVMKQCNHVEHQNRTISIAVEGISSFIGHLSSEDKGIKYLDLLYDMGEEACKCSKSCYHGVFQALLDVINQKDLQYSKELWQEILMKLVVGIVISEEVAEVKEERYNTYISRMLGLLECEHIPLEISLACNLDIVLKVLSKDYSIQVKELAVAHYAHLGDLLLAQDAGTAVWKQLVHSMANVWVHMKGRFEHHVEEQSSILSKERDALARTTLAFQNALSLLCACTSCPELFDIHAQFLGLLESTVTFAILYNNELVTKVEENDEVQSNGFLVKQEVDGGCKLLKILSEFCEKATSITSKNGSYQKQMQSKMIDFCNSALGQICMPKIDTHSITEGRSQFIALLVACYMILPNDTFGRISRTIYPHIMQLIQSRNQIVRKAVSDLLHSKYKPMLLF